MKKFPYQAEREVKFYRILHSVFFLLVLNTLNAQTLVRVVDQSKGLISNNIKSVLKASNDIVWLATDKGVSAYNGENIENYTVLDGLNSNNCWSLEEDDSSRIWVGSYGDGLSYFENGKFHAFSDNRFLASTFVRKLFIKGNYLYVGTESGLSIIDLKTKKNVLLQSKIRDIQIMDFFSYQGDVFVVSYKSGVFRLTNGNLSEVHHGNKLSFFSVLLDGETLYFGLDGNSKHRNSIAKISIKDFLSGKNNYQFFGGSVVWDFVKTKKYIYTGCWGVNIETGGLFQIDDTNSLFEMNYSKTMSKNIQSLHYDQRTNVLFAGSTDLGLFIIDLEKNSTLIDKQDLLFYQKINKQIQVTCTNSSFQFDKHKLTKSQFIDYLLVYKKTEVGKEQISQTKDYRSFSFFDKDLQDVFRIKSCVFEDENYYLNTTFGIFRVIFERGNLIIKDYYPFSASVIYINNQKLFFQLPYSSFHSYSLKNNNKNNIHSYTLDNENNPRDVFDVIKLEDEIIAFSRFKGVFSYVDNSFRNSLKNDAFKSREFILAKKTSRNTALLVSGEGNVFNLVKLNNEFETNKIVSLDLLVGDAILDVCQKDSLIFVATNLGLNVFHLVNKRRYFLDEDHGFFAKEIKRIESFNDSILIFTKKGLFSLKTSFITKEHDCGDLNLDAVFVNGLKVTKEKDHIIQLDRNQTNLKLVLSTTGSKFPSKLYYKYSINGEDAFDSESKKLIENQSFVIPFLPYGLSEISVKTNNLFTGGQHEYNLLTVYRTAPFYENKLFYFFLAMLFSVFGFLIIKRRFKNLHRKEKEKSILEKRLGEAKMEALTSQMSPHFIFNSLNSIQNFVLNNDIDNSINYINSLSVLIRNTLDYSSLKYITLQKKIDYLNLYVKIQNIRFGNKILFVQNIQESLDKQDCNFPPLLLQPIIENCFEHAFDNLSENPTIELNINLNDKKLIILIKDNGSGFEETQKEESKGLKLVEERMKLLGKDNVVKIESSSSGTNVLLILNTY